MTNRSTPHLVLVNLGTPTSATPEAVREFLDEFLSDPAVVDLPRWIWQPILRGMVLRSRPKRVATQYETIWTPAGSPLRVATERMASRVGEILGDQATVSVAYRYGEPSIDAVLTRIGREAQGPVVVVPLFPQETDATTGTAFRRAEEVARRIGLGERYIPRLVPPADGGYIEALADRWQTTLGGLATAPDHLVVSYHGIPVRYDRREGHRYTRHCQETTDAFLDRIGWPAEKTTLAYQSKFGPEPWLTPATADVLAALPGRGATQVAIVAPGFLTEGLETLEELAVRGAETFTEAGGAVLTYVPAVEDHMALARTLADLALRSPTP